MEKEIRIKTGDGHVIYGTLTKAKGKSKRLIIFVHGLAGHKNEHIFFNAARFFPKRGYSTFRFDLYSWQKGARKLRNCTITLHGKDVKRIVNFFKGKGYQQIFLVGHSLGGPITLLSDTSKLNAIVLWDPTYNLKRLFSSEVYKKIDYGVVFDWGIDIVIGKKMYREAMKFDSRKLIKNIKVPIKIGVAGKGILVEGARKYFHDANPPKDLTIIKGATHGFDEEGAEEILFKETLKWLDKF
ncbi:MAG: hypothetical protein HYW25_02250 [Candidatus Aenigmarchaeota archaeon]|nr:hypothetical protein [Candidatus Aenigmarchaeota archaeon]